MTLLELNVNMNGIREALERIALVLERQFPESPIVDEPIDPPKTQMFRIDLREQYLAERKAAIQRGEDPDQWAFQPPRVGRRGDEQ